MNSTIKHIACLLPLLALACTKVGMVEPGGNVSAPLASTSIDASCSVSVSGEEGNGGSGIPTKAIIGQTTIVSLDANFIKLDESRNPTWRQDDYSVTSLKTWEDSRTRILDAAIMSSPDNTSKIHLRSVVFNPRQTYQIYQYDEDNNPATTEDTVTVGYVTRMVGWYPKTYTLRTDEDGTPADTPLTGIGTEYFRKMKDASGTEHECIIFEGKLDGETDVMMTDMREGRYDLRAFGNGFQNNKTTYDYDVMPYGHQFKEFLYPDKGFEYLNYFTFNHYLTGVRLFLQTEGSNLSLIGYNQINDVVFTNQPTSVAIALPKTQARSTEESTLIDPSDPNAIVHKTLPVEGIPAKFGPAVDWWGEQNIPIIRTPMAVNDPDHPEFSDTPEFPVIMKNTVNLDKVYLGYMLVRPNVDTPIEIHTDAGIFSATIRPDAYHTVDSDGNNVAGTTPILQAGYIYNVVIDIKTDGSLEIIIGNEDEDSFRDLAPYNTAINDFEYSNCYMITPETMKNANGDFYDGYYFQAITPGRGIRGMLSVAGAELYPTEQYFEPYSARILWQDKPALVQHVELLHGYVRFVLNPKCHDETDRMTGNAVLAVYDKNGDILWSWHIWITEGLKEIEYNTGNSTFKIMNMNLGATVANPTSTSNVLGSYGLYYQWGRKDPSPGPPSYNYDQKDLSSAPYYYLDQGKYNSVSEYFEAVPTIKSSVMNPLGIIAPSGFSETYANDWLYSSIDQLWGYSPAQVGFARKTIYDPCPYGWSVPSNEISNLFTYCRADYGNRYSSVKATDDASIIGVQLTDGSGNSSFFPFAGGRGDDYYRTDKTHAWFFIGELGDYQDARVDKTGTLTGSNGNYSSMNHRGRSMMIREDLFDSSGKYQTSTASNTLYYYNKLETDYFSKRTNLAPVRCVRYNASDEEPDRPTQ